MNKGHLLVLATALSSGAAVYYNSFATKGIDAISFTLVKNALAAAFLVGLILALGNWKEFLAFNKKQWGMLLAIAIIGGSIPFALFFWGLSTAASAAGASLIYRTLFFFASAIAVVYLKERPKANVALGVGAILLANLLLIGNFGFGLGELAVLAATILWAFEHNISKKALGGISPNASAGISPNALAAARLGIGSAILLVGMVIFGAADPALSGSLLGVPALISAAFLVIYVLTWYGGLSQITVTEATALLSFGGIVTAALQYAFSGKMPTASEGASMLLVCAGCALILWGAPIIEGAYSKIRSKRPAPWKA